MLFRSYLLVSQSRYNPSDLVAVVTRSGRQWIKYVENYESGILHLQGGIKLTNEETAGKYRIIRVRPGEFEV